MERSMTNTHGVLLYNYPAIGSDCESGLHMMIANRGSL